MFIIKDWAGNVLFDGREFSTEEAGWRFLMEIYPVEEDMGLYAVHPKGDL